MKFNTESAPTGALQERGVHVGDVYPCKGGRNYDKKAWVVMSVREGRTTVLSINEYGEIICGETYGTHAFASRELIGRVVGLEELKFDIQWEPR